MIKTFRKSKRSSSNSSSPKKTISRVSSTSSNQTSHDGMLQSPKKVIKALYDYEPQGPGELKFSKGDFFHVLDDVDDELHKEAEANGWIEATNPMTQLKGMVPLSYFEVFDRSRPIMGTNFIDNQHHHQQQQQQQQGTINNGAGHRNLQQTLYAVTLYEFTAEREDELDVMPNENLIICAHHDYEWFIAKPINRLGGPGLVPVSYVKIIDLLNPNSHYTSIDTSRRSQVVEVINAFNIPTVEQWKNQTAKYQASTIPLGSISGSGTPPTSANSQYFDNHTMTSNRSSSGSSISIIEASVDSYQLDHGRYQYSITARLSNGRIRYLYRYYQDFYDLQVKLLELFPYEAGRIENSKRIIPSIPGPLINVNDSISKLRREKLDYYLSNLIALPNHISRSEEVLKLFDVLDNGFDRETDSINKRFSKPISQKSNSHQDRLSQYSNFNVLQQQQQQQQLANHSRGSDNSPTNESSGSNLVNSSHNDSSLSSSPPPPSQTATATSTIGGESSAKQPKVKVKFYFDDDIFVLLIPTNLRLQDLKTKLFKRLELDINYKYEKKLDNKKLSSESIHLFLKNDFEDFLIENNSDSNGNGNGNDNEIDLEDEINKEKLGEFEVNDDEKFQSVLFDKCKLMVLVY
ncbi:bud emergence protein, putative [Candida dubliniensis CD36]|uniref:Bud emergence protein, putative n=1 Tax=Candida dubliniensis (strain CD36 / ATCC MYA-646 / CBS 7987 / NCPF 3949 / NRRL Y-17841) TaxID=573826 RepID=B9WFK3_CANDC|nr:bud emergence protein, putative [Candida dubliniensis CD36]CAX42022.1 bud emergence protein, putative [Candida dubliniensis CD36]